MLFAFSGCAHAPRVAGSLAGKNLPVIKADGRFVTISHIDGKASFRGLFLPNQLSKIELAPGDHTVSAFYGEINRPAAIYTIKFTAEIGHTYLIKYEAEKWGLLAGRPPLIWLGLVDSETGKKVGEILQSMGEPLAEGAVLSVPEFYSWAPPKDKKHLRMFHDNSVRGVEWTGVTEAERYFVDIRVIKLPDLKTEEEFLNYVRDQRRSYYSQVKKGIKDEEDVQSFQGRPDFCAKYRRLHVTREPGPFLAPPGGDLEMAGGFAAAALLLRDRVITENAGFSCRISSNKDFMVDFKFTHESLANNRHGALSEDAAKYFSDLKF